MVKKINNKKEILRAFEEINNWKTIKQISKYMGLSYQPSYSYLKELEKLRFLKHKREGNSHFYSLNLKNKKVLKEIWNNEYEKTERFMKNLDKKTNLVLNEFSEQTKDIHIWFSLLFGSTSRKSQIEKSDIDVLVVSEEENRIKRICNTINLKYNVKLSPLVVSLEEFRKMLVERNEFTNNLIRDKIILSGFENYVNELIKSMEKLKWI